MIDRMMRWGSKKSILLRSYPGSNRGFGKWSWCGIKIPLILYQWPNSMVLGVVEHTVLTATLYNRKQADWACCWRRMSYFSIYHSHGYSGCFGPSLAESRHFSATGLLTKLRARHAYGGTPSGGSNRLAGFGCQNASFELIHYIYTSCRYPIT